MKTSRTGSDNGSDLDSSSNERLRDVTPGFDAVAVEVDEGEGKSKSFREKLRHIITGNPFEITVIVLVIIDCCIVFGIILIDVQLEIEKEISHYTEEMLHILHYISLGILSLFMVEVALKMYVLRLEYLHHKLELLDAVIIIVSFVVDIVYTPSTDHNAGGVIAVELILILRLWRIARIVNGIVVSATTKLHAEISEHQEKRTDLEKELEEQKEKYQKLLEKYQELNTKYKPQEETEISKSSSRSSSL